VQLIGRSLEMTHPDCEVSFDVPPPPSPNLTPVYASTSQLPQSRLRQLINLCCALPWPEFEGLPWSALKSLHAPPGDDASVLESARNRLAVDELTAYRLVMNELTRTRLESRAQALLRGPGLGRKLLKQLGFELTGAQRRVLTEILTDLERPVPMLRLLQGDVGSGKTVIAAFAAIRAAECNCQTVVMAPTELLATQLYQNFSAWLEPLGIRTGLLIASRSTTEKQETLSLIRSGTMAVVIGTHALIEDNVSFKELALVIIDEQHRFGVHQRMLLRNKGSRPHQLVMTATPIPRTLHLTLYADMNVSVLDELPRGRFPITTRVMHQKQRVSLMEWLKPRLSRGEQVYWVCTLIESNDEIPARAAEEALEQLTAELPDFRIGLMHGRLKGELKQHTFEQFRSGAIDLLVATTVIEVGVDVPNATTIVIEDPERLGIAQLHQLRGRVGRGALPGHCILFHRGRLSPVARERLRALRDHQDGFRLAEIDLELRGPGEALGTRQTGEAAFLFADPHNYPALLQEASERAARIATNEPDVVVRLLSTWIHGGSSTLTV
jgi:ATP-dependent DNA helicase RecG